MGKQFQYDDAKRAEIIADLEARIAALEEKLSAALAEQQE